MLPDKNADEETPMKFEIRNASNGAILRVEGIGDGESEEYVYQAEAGNEVEAFADFLHAILENFGPTTSRHSPKRIHIVVKPGDKYEKPR